MSERPIIFSGSMVRAILDGRKTQTRRVVKPQPTLLMRPGARYVLQDAGRSRTERLSRMWHPTLPNGSRTADHSIGPSLLPGDRLWVREAWNTTHLSCLAPGERLGKTQVECVRDHDGFACPCADGVVYAADGVTSHPTLGKARWRSPIHMPRWASRITLEVVSVRVERVQEISEADARAEGALNFDGPDTFIDADGVQSIYFPNMGYAQAAFRELWDSINAKRAPWESNPWVWVIDFRRAP